MEANFANSAAMPHLSAKVRRMMSSLMRCLQWIQPRRLFAVRAAYFNKLTEMRAFVII